ncbi:MAG: FliM/FliN family flagellar motor switch protein [Planctomycetes bacterium]|nr:FliM/FliN family flagellar motor switch protein [Planctomycetota bacterium]
MANLDQSEVDAMLAEAELLANEVSGEPAAEPAALAMQEPPPAPQSAKPLPKNLPPELRRILQIEVPVIVQLADRQMTMKEVLSFNVGSVIEFENRFDAELKLVVTNRQIGLGHAVKVGENFGLRVTRIGTIYDTIMALGGG